MNTPFAIQPSMTLREAGPIWLESRRPYISGRTPVDYMNHLKSLYKAFQGVQLHQITADVIRNYQLCRRATAGPSLLNREVTILGQIMKRAGLWERIKGDYQPMPLPVEKRGRALTEEQEYRLFTIGALNPNWAVCYNAAKLSAHTAAGPGEIRHLRLKDVSLGNGYPEAAFIRIREEGAKNQYRLRTIPLDRQAFEAVETLLRIGRERGAHAEEHYLIPKRVRAHGRCGRESFDPTQCITTFANAWKELRAAADLEGLRMYDLRHHALTRLAEKVPEQVVLKIAGHCSQQMLRKIYAHVRDNAVREAIDTLSRADGWKPSEKTMRLLHPKKVTSAQLHIVKKQAKQITEDAADENGWLHLVGEEG